MTREMKIQGALEAIVTRGNECKSAPSVKYDMCRIYDGERLLMFAMITNNNNGSYHIYKFDMVAYEMMLAFIKQYGNVRFEEI